jgi:hypothetical protein
MTEIEPFLAEGRIVLKEPGVSLKAVQEAIVEPYQADVARTEDVPFPAPPRPLKITTEVEEALQVLPSVFARVQPETRRTLTDAENHDVYAEREALRTIIDLLKQRDEDLKTLIRTHMDVDAEERNIAVPKAQVDEATGQVIVAATERDINGHYVLASKGNPERCPIPGENLEWSREYRSGSTSVDSTVLTQMAKDGEISRAAFLAMTREVRVFDETKALDNAVHNDGVRDEVLKAIRKMTKHGKPSTQLFVRKPKK